MAIASTMKGGTYIIPGHGRICESSELLEYRDMVTIIRDRVQASIKKGMTLEQVKPPGRPRIMMPDMAPTKDSILLTSL